MKKSRYSDEQIVRILREADKSPVPEVAKKYGVSEQSIYGWRKRFGSMGQDDVKHLKQLEQENARLKKLLAERDLEIEALAICPLFEHFAEYDGTDRLTVRSN